MKNIYLCGEIDNYEATRIADELELAKGDPVTFYLNSSGGSVFDALAIAHSLRHYDGELTISVAGLAASSATLILCSGRKVTAAANALFMIHSPKIMLRDNYNARELLDLKETLDKVTETIKMTLASRIKKEFSFEDGDVWFTAQEALEMGLIDEIEELGIMNVMEKKYQASVRHAEIGRIRDLTAMKNENASVNAIIDVAIKRGQSVADVKEYIAALTDIKTVGAAEKIADVITDNMTSGASGVVGQTALSEEEKKIAVRNKVAEFANGLT